MTTVVTEALNAVLGGAQRDPAQCQADKTAGTSEGAVGGLVAGGVTLALTRNKLLALAVPFAAAGAGRLFGWATSPGCRAR